MALQIHLLGDSLVKAYGKDSENFIGGWGEHLHLFFDETHVNIYDYAMGGRSTRSFLNEGRFIDNGNFTMHDEPIGLGPAYPRINKGDFVFIEFAHNDDASKSNQTLIDRLVPLGTPDDAGIYPTIVPEEFMKIKTDQIPEGYESLLKEEPLDQHTIESNLNKYPKILSAYGDSYYPYACAATYKGYLKFYVDLIRQKQAIPILITPVSRAFLTDGKIQAITGHHGGTDKFGAFPYVRAMKQLALQEHVILLDLFEKSAHLFEMLGEQDVIYLQSIKDAQGQTIGEANYGRPAKWAEDYNRYMREKLFAAIDNTHQNRFGSYLMAGNLIECIYNQLQQEATSINKDSDLHAGESLSLLRSYLYFHPTKTVECPTALVPRLPDIKAAYSVIDIY